MQGDLLTGGRLGDPLRFPGNGVGGATGALVAPSVAIAGREPRCGACTRDACGYNERESWRVI